MRALIVEVDQPLLDSMRSALEAGNFAVDVASRYDDAIHFARTYDFDVLLLSLDQKGEEDGAAEGATCPARVARLRNCSIGAPLIALSRSSALDDKVQALGAGADDYLVEPVHPEELLARVNAVVRRACGHCRAVIRTGVLDVDTQAKIVEADGRRLALTRMEYAILEFLCLRKGSVVSRDTLIDHIYSALEEPDPRIIDVHVCRLRKKMLRACGRSYLHTEWGRGFVMRDEPSATVRLGGRVHPFPVESKRRISRWPASAAMPDDAPNPGGPRTSPARARGSGACCSTASPQARGG
jgi:two-component system cell cycle response regulator CtrA